LTSANEMAERLEQVQRAFSAYTIERELGSGGMATVYLAHDKKHERKVAIKVYTPSSQRVDGLLRGSSESAPPE
jgi:serine/threonine protein kinase